MADEGAPRGPERPAPAPSDVELQLQIEAALAPLLAGITVAVTDGVATLQGSVRSAREKARLRRLLRRVRGLRGVVDAVQVEFGEPEYPFAREILSPPTDYTLIEGPAQPVGMEPDFTDDVGTRDVMRAVAEAEPYFPPTDPVVEPTEHSLERLDVVGGFAGTSLDRPTEPADHPADQQLSDEEIAEDVRLALRHDASTTDLPIVVRVHRGVVILRGTVPSLEDTDQAVAVASQVPGVREVIDQLTIAGQ